MSEELLERRNMNIGSLATENYRTDYAGYKAAGDSKTDAFYNGLTPATEKSETKATGDVLGLTMLPYNDTISYGMAAYYSEDSTKTDPVIRVQCNYGGEQRYYNVHVNKVDPRNASQLEMFALSCYQDDMGMTDGGTFGSFTRMKAYAGNAADNGYGVDLNNPENVSVKMDWIFMLQKIAQDYLNNSQTYSQYLDCEKLSTALDKWN